jgi:hypothetical protein
MNKKRLKKQAEAVAEAKHYQQQINQKYLQI